MTRDRSLDIAVTGISARFPQCRDLEEWWALLRAGTVLTSRLDPHRLVADGVAPELVEDPDYVPVRGLLADADRFDNAVFRVSPRDAEMMDPQHRLMLEVAWNSLEDAGIAPTTRGRTTAVYASGSGSGYLRAMLAGGSMDPVCLDQALHGTEPDFIAGLISYKLGLTGPAMAVQTACSSGLVAVHLASQALLSGDCDQALVVAAGVDFPQAGHLHLPGGIQSASGDCRPFDERADGVVAGSGVACIVLRRLEDLRDDPTPYGVILGTAINNDGAAKAGYFAPSASGQEAVIRMALRAAGVDATSLGYLETHGTGTRVGDPIEWTAASSALADAAPGQIAIGALKGNTGHLDAAAGLASLIRALLVVRDGVVAPVAGFRRLNPLLEHQMSPLRVPGETEAWAGPSPRRAGVSAFGVGGTNAHVVIEQPPSRRTRRPSGPVIPGSARLILLSAVDEPALKRSATRLAQHLLGRQPDLADVSGTLASGRTALGHRMAAVGRTAAEVAERLTAGHGTVTGSLPDQGPAPLVLLFPGQGTQRPGMALPYRRVLPGFDAAMEVCLDAASPELASRLRSVLLDPAFPADALDATELAQPALFTMGYAAATSLMGLGLAPAAVLGHSLGEITAACLAGILDLPDAVRLVTARGRTMQDCPPGAMVALGCDEARAAALAAEAGLELAAVNAADSCVVAGTVERVDAFLAGLGGDVFARRLQTVRAFHTSLVGAATVPLAAVLGDIELHPPQWPIAVNGTGRLVAAGESTGPQMFLDGATRPVRFADALASVTAAFPGALGVELGPGRVLSAAAEESGLQTISLSPRRTDPDEELLAALGELWTLGQPVELTAVCAPGAALHLPGYPFEGPRYLLPEVDPARAAARLVTSTGNGPREAACDDVAGAGPRTDASDSAGRTTAEIPPQCSSRTAAEVVLAGLWAELLGHSDLCDSADFFDLGGDSLLVTHLARRIKRDLGVAVPLRELLVARTLGRQSALVRELLVSM